MRPENTLPGFEYAIAVGVDALEMDVMVTRDDVVVVVHDPKLNRAICDAPPGARAIRQLTFAELSRWDCGSKRNRRFRKQVPEPGARIPSLDQVLALAGRGSFLFNIEVKCFPDRRGLTPPPEPFAELVYDAICRHKLEKRVMVQSFDFRILHVMRRLAPEIRLAALYAGALKRFVTIARRAETDIVAPHRALVTARQVSAAHNSGLKVITWTANGPREWRRLIAARVDGIITDNPAALIEYLCEHGLRPQAPQPAVT